MLVHFFQLYKIIFFKEHTLTVSVPYFSYILPNEHTCITPIRPVYVLVPVSLRIGIQYLKQI